MRSFTNTSHVEEKNALRNQRYSVELIVSDNRRYVDIQNDISMLMKVVMMDGLTVGDQ